MSETYDRLPPDQRAVLSLVLERGKSYAQVAAMLSIPEATVRERARAALDSLAAEGTALDGASAEPAAPPSAAPPSATPPSATPPSTAPPSTVPPSAVPGPRPQGPSTPRAGRAATSRTGGALLLAAIVVAVVVAVVLITSGGGSGKSASTATSTTHSTATSTGSTSSGAARPRVDKKLTLSSVDPESPASGEAYVLSDGNRHAFYIAAQKLAPSSGFFYAVWLYNSPSSSAPLGRAPTVGSSGRLEGGGPLPVNAGDYAKIVVTRETSTRARHPGTIVLSGDFALR